MKTLRVIYYGGLIAVNVICLSVFLAHSMYGWSAWAAFMILVCSYGVFHVR